MTYEELQRKAVDILRKAGVWYKYEDRLAIFWLYTNATMLVEDKEQLATLMELFDEMTRLRKEGKEPAHKNGEYERTKDPGSGNPIEGGL